MVKINYTIAPYNEGIIVDFLTLILHNVQRDVGKRSSVLRKWTLWNTLDLFFQYSLSTSRKSSPYYDLDSNVRQNGNLSLYSDVALHCFGCCCSKMKLQSNLMEENIQDTDVRTNFYWRKEPKPDGGLYFIGTHIQLLGPLNLHENVEVRIH